MIGIFGEICEIRVQLGGFCGWGAGSGVLGGRWAGSWGLIWGCGGVFGVIVGARVVGGKSWGGCQFEADAELAEHVEGVCVVDFEVLADVGYRDSILDGWLGNFLGYYGQVICSGVGDKPSIGFSGKIVFGPLRELGMVLNPSDYVSVGVHYSLYTRRGEQIAWRIFCPMIQIIRLFILHLAYVQQFISHLVDTQQTPAVKMLDQAIPEPWTEIERVVVAVGANKYIGIQDERKFCLTGQS